MMMIFGANMSYVGDKSRSKDSFIVGTWNCDNKKYMLKHWNLQKIRFYYHNDSI